MSLSKKTVSLALALSLAPMAGTVVPATSRIAASTVATAHADDSGWIIVLVLLLVTTFAGGSRRNDVQKAENLLDQASVGAGEKIEILANATGKSVEEVSDTIVRLQKEGKISAAQPDVMAQVVAAELSK